MEKNSVIFVAGHRGLVGSALVRKLKAEGYLNIVTKTRQECNLTVQSDVRKLFSDYKIDYVFMAAAKVGGIYANSTYPADFIRENLMILTNIVDSSMLGGVKKLLMLGSSCIYPRNCPQPILEDYLLTGPLEPTNDAYAIAKIAGIKMVQAYHKQYGFNGISLMPTNLYGPGDNFDLLNSHVLPAMIRKFHDAKTSKEKAVTLWGTGNPKREFLHVDDLADACVFLMNNYDRPDIVNVGSGLEVSIRELAEMVSETVDFKGKISWDMGKPDGTPRKLLCCDKLFSLGWRPQIGLKDGLFSTYEWFLNNQKP